MGYRLLDLDNCLSDDAWRIPLIDWTLPPGNARYNTYHLACGEDRLANGWLLNTKEEIVIMTARPTLVATQTYSWLARHNVKFKHVLMRNNSDERCSAEVKETQLQWLVGHYDISFPEITSAFDDHPDIVKMYVRYGIPATRVQAHEVSAYFNPLTQEHAP